MFTRKGAGFVLLLMAVLAAPAVCFAAANVTDINSTQPRGFGGPMDKYLPNACANGPVYNDQGQDCPFEPDWTPGERLIWIRRYLGLSQEAMARRLRVHPGTLAGWERGEKEPKGRFLIGLVRLLSAEVRR